MSALAPHDPPAVPSSGLSSLLGFDEYQESRQRVFPGAEALRWFIRQNRARLIECGALLYIRGRLHIDGAAFDSAVLEIGRGAAKRTERAAA